MIFIGVRYSFGEDLAWGLKNFTSKKVRLNRPPQSPFALMSSRAASSVVVVFRSISTSWHTLSGVSQRYRELYYVIGECIHLWDSVESWSR